MVFEPNYTKVVSSIRDRVGVKQSEIDVRVGAEFDVESVLSVGATLSHLASSSTGRDVTISGLLNISITYISEGSIRAVDYTADFKDKYVADTVIDGELIITGDVVGLAQRMHISHQSNEANGKVPAVGAGPERSAVAGNDDRLVL